MDHLQQPTGFSPEFCNLHRLGGDRTGLPHPTQKNRMLSLTRHVKSRLRTLLHAKSYSREWMRQTCDFPKSTFAGLCNSAWFYGPLSLMQLLTGTACQACPARTSNTKLPGGLRRGSVKRGNRTLLPMGGEAFNKSILKIFSDDFRFSPSLFLATPPHIGQWSIGKLKHF